MHDRPPLRNFRVAWITDDAVADHSLPVIDLAVRDFALPVPRVGSIELHSGYGGEAMDGVEIHARVQRKRRKAHADYEAEYLLQGDFVRRGFRFRVAGRVDGYFPAGTAGPRPRLEEIKSAFRLRELDAKLARGTDTHPYCLQLRTYGYLYYLAQGSEPYLSFHLVSTRTWARTNRAIDLDRNGYEAWLDRRLDELVAEAEAARKIVARRKRAAMSFAFPFARPRNGQEEIVAAVDSNARAGGQLLLQAPTGLGKTVGVLYPALREALERGQRVVYVTPKNSQHAVAEDAVKRFQETETKIRSLTITAKSKICFKNEPLCNPEYCEYARDHYGKVARHAVPALLAKKRTLSAKTFRAIGEQFEVCPFELQFEAAAQADVVICDYNYVFAPRSAFGRIDAPLLGQHGRPNLLVDEAHNLPWRAMDYYSPSLSTVVLERMRPAVQALPPPFAAEVRGLLDECITTVRSVRPEPCPSRGILIDAPVEAFLDQDAKLRSFLSRYLESDVEILPRDPVLRLSFYWSEFTAALEFIGSSAHPEFFTTYQPHGPTGGSVRITCCDASEFLRSAYNRFASVVAFSATLKPFDYYARLSGLDEKTCRTAEFASPFPREHRKLLLIPEVSTKLAARPRNIPKIREVVRRVAALRPGNYFVFFPSFDFLTKTLEQFIPPDGFTVLRQEREASPDAVEAVVAHLKATRTPTLVFAVQGGVFSEGVDYPGEAIVGAFVVGPPLPVFDLERETMRTYYERKYGNGFDYAYTYPAMARAVQAAGRVIRSETDRGLIVLLDPRFLDASYARSMPTDWFRESPSELVSHAILRDIDAFWKRSSLSNEQDRAIATGPSTRVPEERSSQRTGPGVEAS